jgi:NTE family protein
VIEGSGSEEQETMQIGLALGGGGVRGLAHASVLEALDGLGLRPSIIAGTSMGAIVGAIYASGATGREIKEGIRRHLILKEDTWSDVLGKRGDLLKWLTAFSPGFSRGGLIRAERFLKHLFAGITRSTFEELDVPLIVIATDYWSAREVVLTEGELMPALQASVAVPGIFAPVVIAGQVLIDGGITNQVPYDHVLGRADFTIAVDVRRARIPSSQEIPGALEAVLGTFDIMQQAALVQRIKNQKPDLYLQTEIRDVRMLDFGKVEQVFAQAAPAVDLLKQQLEKLCTDSIRKLRPVDAP